jgi:hypothetical protein
MSARHNAVAVLCAAVVTVALTVATSAQDVSGPNLKAAYIYRFALFTQWPADALSPTGPLTICVVGDTAVRDALQRTVKGSAIANRAVVVAFGQPDKPPSPCHMLYVSAVSSARAARLVAGLREVPVLTISDLEGFNGMGGIAEFFYEAGQLRFSIRADAVAHSRLQLSSKLLSLARPAR